MIDVHVRDALRCSSGEAWLIGCGPSLDRWEPFVSDRYPIVAINEACLIHSCDAVVSWDAEPLKRIAMFADMDGMGLPPFIISYVPSDVWERAACGEAGLEWVVTYGRYFDRIRAAQAGWRPGTATVAIGLMAQGGARKIHLVGFDALFAWRTYKDEIPPERLSETSEWPKGLVDALGLSESVQTVLSAMGVSEGPRGSPDRYLSICKGMERVAVSLNVELVEGI